MAKNSEALLAATSRYQERTYKSYNFRLRLEDDSDIIESIEEAKEQGISYREWLREIFEG